MNNSFSISAHLNPNKVFILQKSEVEKRLDPLYYTSNVFGFLKTTKFPIKSVNKISKYTISGFGVGREEQDLTEQGYIQIRPTNLNDLGLLKFDRNIYLDDTFIKTKKDNIIQKNDILFNNTNSQDLVGKTAFFDLDGIYFHSNHITRIRVDENLIRPKFLWIILNTYQQRKIFYTICTNWNNQSGVGLELLNSLKIIVPSFDIQDKVISINDTAFEQKKQNEAEAEKLLASIDDYLLKELGITLPTPPANILKNRIFTSQLSELSGKRFDPRYYQNYFIQFYKNLNKQYPTKKLKEIAEYVGSGSTPTAGGDAYTDEANGVPFIRITNLKKDTIDLTDVLFIKRKIHETSLKRTQLKAGELLLSMAGTIGLTVIVPDFVREANINQALARIILKNGYENIFVKEVLNSKIGKTQTDRLSRPAVQANINFNEIGSLLIPVPPLANQKKIAEYISAIRKEAQQLKDKTKEALKKASGEIENILIGKQ